MFSRNDLLKAISDCESSPMSYQNCEKLATFYQIYDHLYSEPISRIELIPEEIVEVDESSDFLKAINGVDSQDAWKIMNELMEVVQVLNMKLYEGVMYKIGELKK